MFAKEDWSAISFLVRRFLIHYWRTIVFVVMVNACAGFLLSARPLVLAPALDVFVEKQAKPAGNLSELTLNNVGPTLASMLDFDLDNVLAVGTTVAILFVSVTLLIATLQFATQYSLVRVKTALTYDMMTALHRHLLFLPLGYFHKRRIGDTVSRVSVDVTNTTASLESFSRSIMIAVAQIALTAVMLFRTDMLFATLVVGLGILHLWITRALSKRVRSGAVAVAEGRGAVNAGLTESFVGIRVLKTFSAENFEWQKVGALAANVRNQARRLGLAGSVETALRLLVDGFVVGVVLVAVFYAVTQERFTLSGAALFFFLSQQLATPISALFSQLLRLQQLLGEGKRVVETFGTRNPMANGMLTPEDLSEGIAVNSVTFRYQLGEPVLNNVSFKILPGQMMALVGPSGAGKSTVADLILRLYDVERGSITYDNVDIREFDKKAYRRRFGVVDQECLLFNGTIRENIILSRCDSQENLQRAVWASNAEEFINKMPDGLDTVVGDRGIRLSGGQRQRIAIARAIYEHPSILLLDEATSSLDTEGEREVQRALERVSKETTMLVIAHRLSTIVHADQIVLLIRGEIEAVAPHHELLRISPTYRRLYQLQFKDESPRQVAS